MSDPSEKLDERARAAARKILDALGERGRRGTHTQAGVLPTYPGCLDDYARAIQAVAEYLRAALEAPDA